MADASSQERIEIGAHVVVSDGETVGTVAYVIVHPPEMHVVDFVISTGSLLGRDVVVPADKVDRVHDGTVHLAVDRKTLEAFPDYVEVHYRQTPDAFMPNPGFLYPAEPTLWPGAASYDYVDDVKVNAPDDSVGLHEGMNVTSRDGHTIGSVEAVDTDPASGNLSGFVVRHGFFHKHTLRIPVDEVLEIRDDCIVLTQVKDEIERRFES